MLDVRDGKGSANGELVVALERGERLLYSIIIKELLRRPVQSTIVTNPGIAFMHGTAHLRTS